MTGEDEYSRYNYQRYSRIRRDLTALKKYLMLLSRWAGAKTYNTQLHTSKYTDETSETSMPHPGTWGPLKKIHMCTVSKASVFSNILILGMICYVIRWWFFGQCINLLWYTCVLYKYIYVLYVLKKQTPENSRQYCLRPSRRGLVQEDKRMAFVYTHGLFIT